MLSFRPHVFLCSCAVAHMSLALWLMYMCSMIIPHLALFNVMITLGELAWLCNCGGFTQIKKPGLKKPPVPTA